MRSAGSKVKMVMLSIVVGISALTAHAQLNYEYTAGKFLVKGRVVDLGTQAPVGMANIRVINTRRGFTCDADGTFTMYVSKTDSLEFSSMGFVTRVVSVADLDTAKYYTLNIELIHEIINLKQVTIYPFRDLDGFKQAFVDAKDQNKLVIPGIAPPKYSNKLVKPRFYNPISYLYDRVKKRTAADPDFKP